MKKLLMLLAASIFVITSCVNQQPENANKKDQTEKTKTVTADSKKIKDVSKKTVKKANNKGKEEVKEEPLVLPEILAEIGAEKIKKDEVQKEIEKMEKVYKQFGQKLNNKQKQKISKDILNRLIDKKIIFVYAKENKITADPEKVKKQLETFSKSFKKDEDFDKFLKKHKLTKESLVKSIEDRVLRETIITKEVMDKVKIDEVSVKKYYDEHPKEFEQQEQVKARHILYKSPRPLPKKPTKEQIADFNKKEEAAKEKAKALAIKLKKDPKQDFAKLAKELSEGPSAKNGGDLGWFTKKRMVKPFADAAFELKKGEISGVIKTNFGYHVLKVEDKKEAKKLGFEEVKKKIEDKIKRTKTREDIKSFQRMLRTKYKVKVFLK